jgi:hypothetical protein
MAAGDVTITVGTQIRFAVAGSLSPFDVATNLTIGTPTDVTLTMSAVADGAGRQSDKGDLGANRAEEYEVLASFDWTGETPVAGERVELYWAPSTHTTQANGNVMGNSGADAACPGGAVGAPTLAEFVLLCDYIGDFICTDDAGVQTGFIGIFKPSSRYGQLIVKNESGDAFEADNVEAHVVFNPLLRNVE